MFLNEIYSVLSPLLTASIYYITPSVLVNVYECKIVLFAVFDRSMKPFLSCPLFFLSTSLFQSHLDTARDKGVGVDPDGAAAVVLAVVGACVAAARAAAAALRRRVG